MDNRSLLRCWDQQDRCWSTRKRHQCPELSKHSGWRVSIYFCKIWALAFLTADFFEFVNFMEKWSKIQVTKKKLKPFTTTRWDVDLLPECCKFLELLIFGLATCEKLSPKRQKEQAFQKEEIEVKEVNFSRKRPQGSFRYKYFLWAHWNQHWKDESWEAVAKKRKGKKKKFIRSGLLVNSINKRVETAKVSIRRPCRLSTESQWSERRTRKLVAREENRKKAKRERREEREWNFKWLIYTICITLKYKN